LERRYHSAAAEWAATPAADRATEALYPGHWLDTVVAPIYDAVAASMRTRADHVDKKNYDDFNEFFWDRRCLAFHRSRVATRTAVRARNALPKKASERTTLVDADPAFPAPVDAALARSPKTYLEARSVLHVFFAFRRVYAYHVVAFQALATVAFARYLVWDAVYAFEVACGLAVTINALALVDAAAEAALAPPADDGVRRGALAARLFARFGCLAYQATSVRRRR